MRSFKEKHRFSPAFVKKLENLLHFTDSPSSSTLDKLALLAGFQSWSDLREMLYGDADGLENLEDHSMGRKVDAAARKRM